MKSYSFLIITVFIFLFSANTFAGKEIKTIKFNSKDRSLSAPSGNSFEWFFNDKLLSLNSKKIKVLAPGTYKVIITNESGEKEIITTTVTNQVSSYRIFIIGDSTACNWKNNFYPKVGWGQVFGHFFNSSVTIDNRAISGRSAKSFYNNHWAPVRDTLSPGDFVFIQFGINDAKKTDSTRYSEPFTTFQDYLKLFVNEVRAKGAYPVLLTTGRRNAWVDTIPATLYDAYHDYPVATRQLAPVINVPLIDLDQIAKPLMEGLGQKYTGPFMYMVLDTAEYPNYAKGQADNVHFQENGAVEMARLVAESIKGFGSDTMLSKLIPCLKPLNKVTVSINLPEGGIITRSADYPEGIPVTLKVKLNKGYNFTEWQDGLGNKVSSTNRYIFTMGNSAVSFKAILNPAKQD